MKNENALVTNAHVSAVVIFSLQVFICVLIIARGRGLGFEEEEIPGIEGSRIPREIKPVLIMTRTKEINILLQRLFSFNLQSEQYMWKHLTDTQSYPGTGDINTSYANLANRLH